MKRTLLTLSLLALASPLPLLAGPELDPLRRIAIQDGGRTKPLDSFARDLAKRVQGARAFGLDRIDGLEPTEWVLAMLAFAGEVEGRADPQGHARGAARRGEAAARPRPVQLLRARRATRASATRWPPCRRRASEGEDLDPVDREVADLFDTLSTVAGVMNGEALRIVPHPDDPKATWYSLADLDQADVPQVQRVRALTLRARRRVPRGRPAGRRRPPPPPSAAGSPSSRRPSTRARRTSRSRCTTTR